MICPEQSELIAALVIVSIIVIIIIIVSVVVFLILGIVGCICGRQYLFRQCPCLGCLCPCLRPVVEGTSSGDEGVEMTKGTPN